VGSVWHGKEVVTMPFVLEVAWADGASTLLASESTGGDQE